MKILHTVQRYAPDVGGSEEVIRQISEHLVKFGHEVTVATSFSIQRKNKMLNGVEIQEFGCSGNVVEGIHGDSTSYINYIKDSKYDVMLNYAAQIWSTDLVYNLLPSITMKKILVPCGYSRLHDGRFKQYFDSMPEILKLYDAVVYHSMSYIDKQFADNHNIDNGIVIPNGSSMEEFNAGMKGEFRKKHKIGNNIIVLNVSNHSWLKGHDFFWRVVPALKKMGIVPVLIGNSYHSSTKKWLKECYRYCRYQAFTNNALNLEGYSRKNTIEVYVDADIFLFGSKVECAPLVMYEAFASKTLFISLDCGNVKDYADIVCIVRNELEALEIIRDYREHPESYKERIEKGYRKFLDELNWECIARKYEKLYKNVIRGEEIFS
ncbi:MAG: glycosyltransferase family 4 protein [Bacteroidota bacterium]